MIGYVKFIAFYWYFCAEFRIIESVCCLYQKQMLLCYIIITLPPQAQNDIYFISFAAWSLNKTCFCIKQKK